MPDTPALDTTKAVFQSIAIDQIKPSRHQARKIFDEETIKGLAESMKQETLLQPITVRQSGDGYELISGERRFRAAKLLGWTIIDAKVIQTVSEGEAAAKGLIENLQREDLNPIEEAQGFQELLDLKDSHWNQERISEAVGKSPTYISESLSLLKLPDPLMEKFCRQNFSRSLGVELARLPGQDVQLKAAEAIEGLNRNQARDVLMVLKGKSSTARKESKAAAAHAPDPKAIITFTAAGPDIKFSGLAPEGISIEGLVDAFRERLYAWMRVPAPQKNPAVEAVFASDDSTPSDSSPRTPKTPEEQAELEALAAQNPQAAYEWIFGPESILAKRMTNINWQAMGISDPKTGLNKLLEGMKMVAASHAARKKRR